MISEKKFPTSTQHFFFLVILLHDREKHKTRITGQINLYFFPIILLNISVLQRPQNTNVTKKNKKSF